MGSERTQGECVKAECVPAAGFSFNKKFTSRIGHVNEMTFTNEGIPLVADISVADPTDPDTTIKVVGVFDFARWDGEKDDPHTYEFRVSPTNRGKIKQANDSNKGGVEVAAKVTIYEYNFNKKAYWVYFTSDDPINYVVTKGTQPQIDPDPATDVTQPVNFRVRMILTGVCEEGQEQFHTVDHEDGSPKQKPVGVPVGA